MVIQLRSHLTHVSRAFAPLHLLGGTRFANGAAWTSPRSSSCWPLACCASGSSSDAPNGSKTSDTMFTALLIICIAVFGYLLHVLVKPEKY
jgi:F subunit of K+-transporting ATPase (Potass_KdpF)